MKFEIDLDLKAPGMCYVCPLMLEDNLSCLNRCAITYSYIKSEDSGTHGSVWMKPENCPLRVKE